MTKKAEKPMSKGKKALNIALIVLQVAIVIVAIAFSISILLSTGYESSSDFGKSSIRLMPVLTDSMAGDKEDSFKAGDLIIVKSAEKVDLSELEAGDIITYLDNVGGDLQFVTHRIIDIKENELANGSVIREFTTMGDAEDPATAIPKTLYEGDIKGVYVGKLAGVGNAVFWLQDPTHFFLVIMLPLILLLLYNAYLVVRIIIEAKLKKQREQLVGATAEGSVPLDEEEIKRRAVEEYIKKKAIEDYIKEQENAANAQPADENAKETEQENAEAEETKEPEVKEPENAVAEAVETSEPENEEKEKIETAEEKAEEPAKEAPEAEQKQEEPAVEEKQETPAENVETAEEKTEEPTEQNAAAIEEKADEKAEEAVESEVKAPAKKPAAKKPAAKTAKTTKTASAAKKPAAKTTTKSAAKPAAKTAAKSATKTTKTATAKTAAKKTTTAKKTATAGKTEKKS